MTTSLRTTVFRTTIAAAALIAAAGSSEAVEYRLWYHDDMNYYYQPGDIAFVNEQPMTPPSWACGRRFFDPSYGAWRGHYHEVLSSFNFWTDIHVWLPLGGGCPENTVVVKTKSGATTYQPAPGTHFLSIYSNYGGYWINANGGWPSCNCALAKPYLKFATELPHWAQIVTGFDDVVRLPVGQGTRLFEQTASLLAALRGDLARVVGERRRASFGSVESTVRQLEDQATTSTATAARQADECRHWLGVGAADSAFRACTQAGQSVERARAAMAVVVSELHQ